MGLPLALRFTQAGVKVTGFDIDPDKPRKLHAGQSYTPSALQARDCRLRRQATLMHDSAARRTLSGLLTHF